MSDKADVNSMCEGPLFGKLVRYVIPLWLTGLLQIAFHAADMAVLGRFASHKSMAGIGATGELVWLLVCVVVGISAGSNVVVAQMFGAGDRRGMRRAVHASIAFALASGLILMALGETLLVPVLRGMNVPDDIFLLSRRYLRICFCGLPFSMVCNFSFAIMRGIGDSRRPLYYLLLAATVNLLLNILLVAGLHLDVAGVAVATVLSQALSCSLSIRALLRERGSTRLMPRSIRFYPAELKRILRIGVPSGLQYACYSSANVIIQSAVNTLGPVVIAGNTAACVLEAGLHTWPGAVYQTVMTAVGQNYGAEDCRRVMRSILFCIALATLPLLVLGGLTVWNGEFLLGVMNRTPEVVAAGMVRVRINFTVYFLLGAMDTVSGALRGLGRSFTPMIVTVFGACALRVFWVFTVFHACGTLPSMLAAYPVSWLCVTAVNGMLLFFVCRALLSGNEKSMALKLVR